jgi:hypothetical protein
MTHVFAIVLAMATALARFAREMISFWSEWRKARSETKTAQPQTSTLPAVQSNNSLRAWRVLVIVLQYLAMLASLYVLIQIAAGPGTDRPISAREAALIAINLGIFLMASRPGIG